MVKSDKKANFLISLLKHAYYEKEKLLVGDEWQNVVMQRIRSLDMLPEYEGFIYMFEHIVWRLSPAIAIIIVVFALTLWNWNIIPDSEIFKLMYNGLEEYSLSKILAA